MSTKSTPTISDKRRSEIERQVRKRVALEKQAFEYVKHLCVTDSVTDEELVNIGQHITRGDYADITEERSIGKICGYPLCSNLLTDVLKQKYKISLKNSTVYDITERKKFCSNQCYEASKHFHQQISETPVWLRDKDPSVQLTVLHREDSQSIFPRGRNGESVLDSPWHKVKEELQVLDEENKIGPQATGVRWKQNSPSVSVKEMELRAEKDTSHPGDISGRTIPSPNDQAVTPADPTVTKKTRPINAWSILPFSEKLNFIREWRTRQTVEFFHSYANKESEYKERVLQFYGGKPTAETDEREIHLAPVDHMSQHMQRRRIVLQNLSNCWEKLETLLKLDLKDHLDDIKSIVNTFEFSNKNILFKPVEWLIVGYILLRILDEKKKFLNDSRIDLKQYSITEKEVAAIVEYMRSVSDEMEMVD